MYVFVRLYVRVCICLFELLFEWLLRYNGYYCMLVCYCIHQLFACMPFVSMLSQLQEVIIQLQSKSLQATEESVGPSICPSTPETTITSKEAEAQTGCLFCYDVIREKKMDITLVMNVFVWNEYLPSSI